MRGLVQRFAEGSLAGVLLKYTKYHVHHCTRCRQAVEVLKAAIARLKKLKDKAAELPEDRWASIEAAWLEHEQTNPPD